MFWVVVQLSLPRHQCSPTMLAHAGHPQAVPSRENNVCFLFIQRACYFRATLSPLFPLGTQTSICSSPLSSSEFARLLVSFRGSVLLPLALGFAAGASFIMCGPLPSSLLGPPPSSGNGAACASQAGPSASPSPWCPGGAQLCSDVPPYHPPHLLWMAGSLTAPEKHEASPCQVTTGAECGDPSEPQEAPALPPLALSLLLDLDLAETALWVTCICAPVSTCCGFLCSLGGLVAYFPFFSDVWGIMAPM